MGLERRDFLIGAIGAGAGIALSACTNEEQPRPVYSASATQSPESVAPTKNALADRSAAVLKEPTTPENALFKSVVEFRTDIAQRIITLADRDLVHKQVLSRDGITSTVYEVPHGDEVPDGGPYCRLTVDKVPGDDNPTSIKGFSLIVSDTLKSPKQGQRQSYVLDASWQENGFTVIERSESGAQINALDIRGTFGERYEMSGDISLSTRKNQGKVVSDQAAFSADGVNKTHDRVDRVLSMIEKGARTKKKVPFTAPSISIK